MCHIKDGGRIPPVTSPCTACKRSIVVHFSSWCKMVCPECKNLLKAHILKNHRKEKRATIHPLCNKRYLTSEEMKVVLQSEKNARLNAQCREQYWRKNLSAAVQLKDDDQETSWQCWQLSQRKGTWRDVMSLGAAGKNAQHKKQTRTQMTSKVSILHVNQTQI